MTLPLHAGPLTLLFENGMIRCVRYGDVEIVRRVYMALRDQYWNTVPYTLSGLTVEQSDDSFIIRFAAHHTAPGIDFLWQGEFAGAANGCITLTMDGEAVRAFHRNRIGWCVLHPLMLCKDAPCTVEHTGGSIEHTRFPGSAIAPHQSFKDVQAMTYDAVPGVGCTIRFGGDVFETEDQRNWTDGSFKTYSTPQSLPVPVTVVAGIRIGQSVTISLAGSISAMPVCVDRPMVVDVEKSFGVMQTPLRIGLRAASHHTLTHQHIGRLQYLGCSHLRFDCTPGVDDLKKKFVEMSSVCSAIGAPAELALHLSPDFLRELDLVAQVICMQSVPVSRWLIIRSDMVVTPPETLAAARETLGRLSPSAPIAVGTNRYFVEINRAAPLPVPFDALWFSATPQVHTSDNRSIMENVGGLAECIRHARTIAGGKPVMVSPLTLRPRHDPQRPGKQGGADARQQSLFGAAWLTGAIAAAVASGLDALTCLNAITGDEGVMSGDGDGLFPLYHVLASGICRANDIAACLIDRDGPALAALKWGTATGSCMLVANLTDAEVMVAFGGLQTECGVAMLDESTIGNARREMRFWERATRPVATGRRGTLSLMFAPYAVVRLGMVYSR